MSTTGLAIFDRAINDTNTWLAGIMDAQGVEHDARTEDDRAQAYHALRAVLITLRERIPTDLAAAFGAQLPVLVRGVFYESFQPENQPDVFRKEGVFFERVAAVAHAVDLDGEAATRAVFTVVNDHLTGGLCEKVRSALPEDGRAHWPEPVA